MLSAFSSPSVRFGDAEAGSVGGTVFPDGRVGARFFFEAFVAGLGRVGVFLGVEGVRREHLRV